MSVSRCTEFFGIQLIMMKIHFDIPFESTVNLIVVELVWHVAAEFTSPIGFHAMFDICIC